MSQLKRELTRWDLTAIGVNQVIGGAVFAVPAAIAASLGGWSWIAVGIVGLLSMAVALNFAEAGSRVDATGGPYLYTRAAFGRFVGFEIGWLGWLIRLTSWASVVNVLVSALGYYWPDVTLGWLRDILISGVVLAILALNVRGIRHSSIALNVLTIGKLTPLVLFIAIGLPHVSAAALHIDGLPLWSNISAASLLLIFAFGGYEIIPVPAGEARNPREAVPFAMITAIAIVAIVITLTQLVALGTLAALATSKTPLADAAAIFIGPAGAALMTIGAMISVAGNNVGAALSGSRMLFALAEQGDVPKFFGHIHPRYRTPDVAIVITCLATLVLALTGSFVQLAAISALARLLVYAGTCASVLALRRQGRAPFTIPGGPVIPVVALAVCGALLFGMTWDQFIRGFAALVVGAILFFMKGRRQNSRTGTALAVLTLALVLVPAIASAQQMIFVVRHAERADDGKGITMNNKPADPPLSAAGEMRAAKLEKMLADAGIKAIYVTEFRRTQDTARPLAAKIGVKVEEVASKDTGVLVAKVRKEHPNDTVLIVGHSNTIPDIVKAFTGKVVTVGDDEYTAMFVLTPSAGTVALIRW